MSNFFSENFWCFWMVCPHTKKRYILEMLKLFQKLFWGFLKKIAVQELWKSVRVKISLDRTFLTVKIWLNFRKHPVIQKSRTFFKNQLNSYRAHFRFYKCAKFGSNRFASFPVTRSYILKNGEFLVKFVFLGSGSKTIGFVTTPEGIFVENFQSIG